MKVDRPVALVTGANRGIGKEVCRQLAEEGFTVLLTGRELVKAQAAVATNMGGSGGRPVADGARGIVWAALLPDDGPSGEFFRDGKRIDW